MKSNVVSMEWLREHLHDDHIVVVDCRFPLGNMKEGREQYLIEHISGAFYLDLEQDLSGQKGAHGGRHPLPNIDKFSHTLGNIGITNNSKVIAYDEQGEAMASRLWWLLKYLGHEEVYVLDGSFSQWKEQGYSVSSEIPKTDAIVFTQRVQNDMMVSMEEVQQRLDHPNTIFIDSREEIRYRGESEPIDRVAGHIPGAINFFWKDSMNEDGKAKSAEELKNHFRNVDAHKEVIVYCGSGVTACPNVLALKEAGYTNVKLYVGSWSDWSSYPDNPIGRS